MGLRWPGKTCRCPPGAMMCDSRPLEPKPPVRPSAMAASSPACRPHDRLRHEPRPTGHRLFHFLAAPIPSDGRSRGRRMADSPARFMDEANLPLVNSPGPRASFLQNRARVQTVDSGRWKRAPRSVQTDLRVPNALSPEHHFKLLSCGELFSLESKPGQISKPMTPAVGHNGWLVPQTVPAQAVARQFAAGRARPLRDRTTAGP